MNSRPSVLYMEQMRSSRSFWPKILWCSISWNTIREAGYLISAGILGDLNELLLENFFFIICEKATNNSCKHSYRSQTAEPHICRLKHWFSKKELFIWPRTINSLFPSSLAAILLFAILAGAVAVLSACAAFSAGFRVAFAIYDNVYNLLSQILI